jgi:hypothetical protein
MYVPLHLLYNASSADLQRPSTFLLTVYKVLRRWHITGRSKLFRAFLKDGVQYFAVVTSANLVNIVYMKSKIRYNGVELQGGSFVSRVRCIAEHLNTDDGASELVERAYGSCHDEHDGVKADYREIGPILF